MTLPHTFVNGTIADAVEVNENFAALQNAMNDSRYELTVEPLVVAQSVKLDTLRLFSLCRDGDGCTVRVCQEHASQSNPPPNCAGPFTWSIHGQFGMSWAIYKNGLRITGRDNDNTVDILHQVEGCTLSDGVGSALSGGITDDNPDYGLQASLPAASCKVAVLD